jgi:hypothetical protein
LTYCFFNVKYSRGGPHCIVLLEPKQKGGFNQAKAQKQRAAEARLGEGIYTEKELKTFVFTKSTSLQPGFTKCKCSSVYLRTKANVSAATTMYNLKQILLFNKNGTRKIASAQLL